MPKKPHEENIPLVTGPASTSYNSISTSPVNLTPANTSSSTPTSLSENSNTLSYFFKQQFKQDFPMGNFNGSLSISGDMKAFKF
jgi:hypothetical protein